MKFPPHLFSPVPATALFCLTLANTIFGDGPSPVLSQPFGAPTRLTATLADPINIDLKWDDNATNEAGYFVEYSPDANDDYLKIEALPSDATTYRHPHLLPETRFVFRVRPFFGHASNSVEITTGKEGPQRDVSEPPEPPASLSVNRRKYSLRSVETMAAAAPASLTVVLIPPAGVRLQWEDHANDADGYLVEIKAEDGDYRPSAFLEPGTTTLTTYNFPFESKFSFRVRAFFQGQASNLAEQTTGLDPAMHLPSPPAKEPSAGGAIKTGG